MVTIAPSQPPVLQSIPETVTLPPPAASVTAPRIAVIEVACFSRDVMVLRNIQWTRARQRVVTLLYRSVIHVFVYRVHVRVENTTLLQ